MYSWFMWEDGDFFEEKEGSEWNLWIFYLSSRENEQLIFNLDCWLLNYKCS